MAIPIKRYIDIASSVVTNGVGDRDFSGLVFTSESATGTSTAATNFNAGQVVSLNLSEINGIFAANSNTVAFATKYFSVKQKGRYPRVLNLAKTGIEVDDTAETLKQTFDRVISTFDNFGTFTFLGVTTLGASGAGGLLDIATENSGFGYRYLMVVPVTTADASTFAASLGGLGGVHLVLGSGTTNFAAYMAMGWAASINYYSKDASSTLMYKDFGNETATVTSESDADTYDGLKVNYVGLVQTYGASKKFYQTGVNSNGLDAGVYLDACWLNQYVESEWFNLVQNGKLPANGVGVGRVLTMLTGVAVAAVANGVILVDKVLSNTQIANIEAFTGDENAAAYVQSRGWYTHANLVTRTIAGVERQVVEYILCYGKGDNIYKCEGSHALV